MTPAQLEGLGLGWTRWTRIQKGTFRTSRVVELAAVGKTISRFLC